MIDLRQLPLKYRLPLTFRSLELLALSRKLMWGARQTPAKGPLVVSGFFTESLGIGRAGRMTAHALEQSGYQVIRHNLRNSFRHILTQDAGLPGEGGVWIIHGNAPEVLIALLANHSKNWCHRYRIGYWAWETPKAPTFWLRVADWLHEIWVPSHFVREALIAAAGSRADNISAKIRILPHPLLTPPLIPDRKRFGLSTERCEVLSLFDVNSSQVRKNPWASLEAWLTAFPQPTPKAALTLKASSLDTYTSAELSQRVGTRADIRLFTEKLDDGEMDSFVGSFDVFMSLHRSEGFGLGLLEAMNAGIAVIATDWSGSRDILTKDNGYPIPYRLVPVNDPEGPYSFLPHDPAQVWAEPDIAAAADILRRLVDDPAHRTAKTPAARATPSHLNRAWSPDALKACDFNRWLDS